MLTRIEIDGFKTFEDFGLDLPPFLVILGPNAAGKSNLFDAIRLISRLAHKNLKEAFQELRGEVQEVFRSKPDGTISDRIRFAAEVLVEPTVRDAWGQTVELSHTRIRYEVEIRRWRDERGLERLIVTREQASPILIKDDEWPAGKGRMSQPFRDRYIHSARRSPWLSTEENAGEPSFEIHQDGKAGRTRPAHTPGTTVLSSITNTTEFPHLYALREELSSWRFLHLDPAALRKPSDATDDDVLKPDGSNLASVLARIEAETTSAHQVHGALPEIAADLASVIPGVLNLAVHREEKKYRVDIATRDAPPISSRIVSDGTLRVLALLTILHDPEHRGLICFEEPENGIHPARLGSLLEVLRSLVTDPADVEIDSDLPLSQLVMNSHSPVVLSALQANEAAGGRASDFVFADLVSVTDPETRTTRTKTRMRPVQPVDQGKLPTGRDRGTIGRFEVQRYLSTVGAVV